jgi:hypothetical protein
VEVGEGRAQTEENIVQSHVLPTQRGAHVTGIERCAIRSSGKEAGTVHHSAPPCDIRSAPGQLLRAKSSKPRPAWTE